MNTLELPLSALHELASLRDHMRRCATGRSAFGRLLRVAETVDAFLAPRFVTTLGVTLLVLAGTTLVA